MTKFSRFRTQNTCDMPLGFGVRGFGTGTETHGTNETTGTYVTGRLNWDNGTLTLGFVEFEVLGWRAVSLEKHPET
jgi:hypothetical protein